MLLRDKVLVEKCINTIMWDYNRDLTSDINAKQDLQLSFMEFLAINTPEQVEYGIEYTFNEYQKEYEVLCPIIKEYKTYGFTGTLSDLKVEEPEVTTVPITKESNWAIVFKKADNSGGTITQEMPESTECPTSTTEPTPLNIFSVKEQKTPLTNYWKEIIKKIWG